MDGDVEQGFNPQRSGDAAGGLSFWLPQPPTLEQAKKVATGTVALGVTALTVYNLAQDDTHASDEPGGLEDAHGNGTQVGVARAADMASEMLINGTVALASAAAAQLGGQQAEEVEPHAIREGSSWSPDLSGKHNLRITTN